MEFAGDALAEIVRLTQGYPYFLQEWGYQTWNRAATSPIALDVVQGATPTVIQRLDENFFRVRFDRCAPGEKRYLRAMASLGPGAQCSRNTATRRIGKRTTITYGNQQPIQSVGQTRLGRRSRKGTHRGEKCVHKNARWKTSAHDRCSELQRREQGLRAPTPLPEQGSRRHRPQRVKTPLQSPELVSRDDGRYPARLRQCLGEDAPRQLSALGNLDLLTLPKTGLFCSARCPGHIVEQAPRIFQLVPACTVPARGQNHGRMKTSKGKGRGMHAAHKRSKDRQLVLLDQGPLRKKAASECSRQMARLEKAKAEWKRFQVEDKAAFARWMASTFGALLSRLREIEAAVHSKEAMVREVEAEMFFGGARSPRAAYARVQSRRDTPHPEADPHASPPPPPSQDDDEGFEGPDLDELAQEMLFENFLRAVMGMNSDRMSDAKYEKMFGDFKANVLGHERPERQADLVPPKPLQSRIKELYRQLVRRLHPDTRAESDAEVSAVWHEVQEAYSDGNVERLEMLLAMTDLQENATGEHTSLSQMRSVLSELRRSYNALQRNLREAKSDPAWNFGRMQDRSTLAKRIERDIKLNITSCEKRLEDLESEIARWSAPPKTRKRQVGRQQTDFFF